jgi:transcriptional regulator with XRE-family HTH domain
MSISGDREGQGWIFQLAAERGESFDHYLGRFRRANCLSRAGLGELLGIETLTVSGWEMPSLDRPPRAEQLKKVSALVGISEAELTAMLPVARSDLHLETRLCPFCYGETPIHQSQWQQAKVEQCDRHASPFLSCCSACGSGFRLPALWESGCCERCWLPFGDMGLQRREPTG